MDLDKTSLCEVPKALMYIVRYVPMDNDDDVNGDGRGDMADRDSSTVSRESVRLSVSVSLLLFFLVSFCLSVSRFYMNLFFRLIATIKKLIILPLSGGSAKKKKKSVLVLFMALWTQTCLKC